MPPARRMRLLVAAQPLVTGVPRHVIDLLDPILSAGWEVTIACPTASELWAAAGARGLARVATNPARAPGPRDLVDLVRLLRLVRGADVVHAHSSKSGFVVRLAAALTGRRRRVVFTPHGWSFWAFSGRVGACYLALERLAARWCAAIITVSDHERDAGLGAGVGRAEQYRVIPNGVDERRFPTAGASVGHGRPRDRLVMVARLAPPRLPLLAVDALGRVRASHPTATLDLVGEGVLRPEVEAAVAAAGLDGAVRLLGARDDVPDLLLRSGCAVHLSTYEGASLGVLEAMAAGLPVVASRIGGMDELVVDGVTGTLVENEADAVAAAVTAVLDRDDGGAALGEAGRDRVLERFTASRMAATTLAVYEELARP